MKNVKQTKVHSLHATNKQSLFIAPSNIESDLERFHEKRVKLESFIHTFLVGRGVGYAGCANVKYLLWKLFFSLRRRKHNEIH